MCSSDPTVVVEEDCGEISKTMKQLMAIVKNGDGSRLMELYNRWDVSEEPKEITLADGTKRMSWPKSWEHVEKELRDLHINCGENDFPLSDLDVASIKAETVDNAEKPWLTVECMTWPALQNVFRDAWVHVHGEWKPAEHKEGMPFFALLRGLTLNLKVEGLAKALKELKHDESLEKMWAVYSAWPNPFGEEEEIIRFNRKSMKDSEKQTWPLPFESEGDAPSVTSVLTACGWSEFLIGSLKTVLFDKGKENQIHPQCTPAQVSWPDLQQAFRSAIAGDQGWHTDMDREWPPLAYFITLRLKIPKDRIESTLVGEWRMYCKPDEGQGQGPAFSYGLMINKVDMEHWTFEGGPRQQGKYKIENGKMNYTEESGRLQITYDEVWPCAGGLEQRDKLIARVKSNGKFQCESASGFEQKATREDLNLPSSKEERIGQGAKHKIKKYYVKDEAAAEEEEKKEEASEEEAEEQ